MFVSVCLTVTLAIVADVRGAGFTILEALEFRFTDSFGASFMALGLPPNVLCDTLTILVTFHIVVLISRSAPIVALALVLLDILIAGVLVIATVTLQNYTTGLITEIYGFEENLCYLIGGLISIFDPGSSAAIPIGQFLVMFGATTFIPTVTFLMALAALILARGVAEAGKRFAVVVLGTAVDHPRDSLPVFTMVTGLSAAIVTVGYFIQRWVS